MDEYARPDGNGGWRQVAGAVTLVGAGVSEILIDRENPELGFETVTYDLVLPLGWEETWTVAERNRFGIKKIAQPNQPPAGLAVTGREIFDNNGSPKWRYTTAEISLVERQAALLNAITAERDARNAEDFVWDFGSTVAVDDFGAEEPAGERALQMRPEDQRNWAALQGQAVAAVMNGAPDHIMPMRAGDNANIQTTAAETLAILAAMSARSTANLFRGGRLKSEVRAAVAADDAAALDALDISTGWAAAPSN